MTAFKIQVLSTLAIKCQGDFRIFQFALPIHQQKKKDSAEAIQYYVGNGFSIPQHFPKLKQLRLLILPKLYCLLITHLNK